MHGETKTLLQSFPTCSHSNFSSGAISVVKILRVLRVLRPLRYILKKKYTLILFQIILQSYQSGQGIEARCPVRHCRGQDNR